ncbi:hypothetical protein BBJ28_00013212 [Nothophytophthora sp. Chile5]|nr:hypothetical protein BBJ28_00013212 [Nothophytophthora sp. Chile5]
MEHADQTEKALVTLALRGERIPLRDAVSSVYNPSRRELLVASASTLYLYGRMLTAGGALLGVLAAEENVHFQFVLQIPWKTGECDHYEDCVVFHENLQRSAGPSGDRHAPVKKNNEAKGIFLVDACARFTIANCSVSTAHAQEKDNDSRLGGDSKPVLTLPFNPLSEPYHALHTDMSDGERNLVFVVWSTGFCILEIFFPNSQGRRVCTTFDGEHLKRLSMEKGDVISIYQRLPSPRMVLLEEGYAAFRVTPVQPPVSSDTFEETEAALCMVDYFVEAQTMVALWSNGVAERYALTLDVFAYIDRCIERLDQLGPKDKDAARERLQLGRISSAQHALPVQGGHRSLVTDAGGGGSENGSAELSQHSYPPAFQHLNQASVLAPGAPSVRISITLPAVEEQTKAAVIASSATTAPINAVTDSTVSAPDEKRDEEKDTKVAIRKSTQVDMAPILPSRGVGKSAIPQEKGLQDKVSVVSLADYEDESILVLDFKPGTRRSRLRGSPKLLNDDDPEFMGALIEIPFVPWEGLSERERRVELMAASKSRCVQEDAESDGIRVPPVQDFESLEIPVQLGVRSFTRWFAATQRRHQRIRERFLLEELRFAATDSVVHHKLTEAGLTPPSLEQTGSSGSTAWQEFAAWYSLGRVSTPSISSEAQVLQTERLKARTGYLELRLRLVAQAELEVQQEEEAAGPCEEECEPPQRVFVFEHFVKKSLSDKENASSWENTSLDNRQKEITLALLDPAVQVAAMKNEIELPDVSSASLEDCDFFTLAGKFIPWWKVTRNSHRRDFLAREVQEASKNKAILELLAQEQLAAGDGELRDGQAASKTFLEAYFRSDTARHTFLKKKLFYLRRKSRIASVARYGKLPAPLVLETLPLPLAISFLFVEKLEIEEVEAAPIAVVEDEKAEEPEELRVKEAASAAFDNQDDADEQERRRIEHENARRILELINMTQEDAISREYNRGSEESDDEVEEQVLAVPKRTDFSRSYFFGNLPIHFRTLVSCGWQAGSGIDNGDEEQEEEEQLERERERQRLLDEQEAERLLELERQAERARIEKERDERAFQFRRVRQTELKKVLVRQEELEAQRKLSLESVHLGLERDQMLREDESARWHRDQLLRDQDGMALEDRLASSVRRELREAATARMRLLLYEHACMNDEDQRSMLVGDALREQERLQASRRAYLSELYTPFSPFFQSSSVGSEDFLPRIQRRLELEQERRTPVAGGGRYTIPVADALLLDEVDQDPYLARDSRKFKQLMGLPVRTPSSQRRPRIPTEAAIILMQQQRHSVDVEERQETPSKDRKPTPLPRKVAQHSHARERNSRPDCLPAIVLRNASPSTLTDLKEACRMQTTAIPALHKATSSNQQQQQNQPTPALPFFRGNMIVQGHSQARAKDYSC